jgi:N-dimethylarginine dimethylaminohydrolase
MGIRDSTLCQRNSHGLVRKLLLCAPTYYRHLEICESVNRLLEGGEGVDLSVAAPMHAGLASALTEAGIDVFWERPHPDHPWQVFARDSGVNTPLGVLVGRHRHDSRRGDEEFAMKSLEGLGSPVVGRVARGAVEGGDCWLVDEETLVIGAGSCSSLDGIANAAEILSPHGIQVLPVEFDPKWSHLDLIFSVIGEKIALFNDEALPPAFQRFLKDRGWRLVPLPTAHVRPACCNVLSLGEGRVLSFAENETVNDLLVSEGLEVLVPPLEEFAKMGVGPRCLTFELERDA